MKKALITIAAILIPCVAAADYYNDALDAAQQFVARQKSRQLLKQMRANGQQSQALSTAALRFGLVLAPTAPNYKVGDQWTVISHETLMMTAAEVTHESGKSALFNYEVLASDSSGVRIRVTPQVGYGLSSADPNVRYMDMYYSTDLKLLKKSYKIRSYTDEIEVSPDSIKIGVSPMEGYPLELPQLSDADKDTTCDAAPQLPAKMKQAADEAHYAGFAVISPCWQNYDLFGRHVQSIWPMGQVFPSYIKSTQGISILISQGGAH
jgi:hypothetical protein